MSQTLVDQEARDRIRTSLGESLLVEAGAGTGKTTVLVARLVEILRTGHATIDELVVITFTEKAATELAGRVREGLEHAREETEDADEEARLDDALRGLYRSRIETIHAFATSLLKERPVEGPVDPGLRVLDEVAASVLFGDEYDLWLEDALETSSEAMARAIRRGFSTAHLRQLAEVLNEQRAALPATLPKLEMPDIPGFLVAVDGAADAMRAELEECKDHEDGGYLQALKLLTWIERLEAVRDDDAEVERRVLFARPKIKTTAGAKARWHSGASLAAVKTAFVSLEEAIDELAGALRDEVIADVVPLVTAFVDAYRERRRAEGVADFDDLLVWARDLLRTPQVRTYFQSRYRCVLVDEFQDTDAVQTELVQLLTATGGDGVPEPGRLTVVGDPKQSIYRFRRADIKVYDEVKFGALKDGQAVIQQNFRSVDGVLGWVNQVFQEAFGTGKQGVQPAQVDLLAVRHAPAGSPPAVKVIHGDGEAVKADDVREQEAQRLAAVLDLAVRTDPWTVVDPETSEERPARWRDCVILLPARTGIEHYIDALTARGIPFRAETRGAFFQASEVAELTAMLRAIDDPTDTPSIVATMRSRGFGCSDDDLLAYSVAAGGRIDYRFVAADGPVAAVEALETLGGLHRQRRGLSLAELVRRTIEAAGYVELALARGGSAQVAANVLKVAEQARAFTVSGGGGLRAFTRWLSAQEDQEVGEAEASVSEESDDLVRLMTIHAAKGLEFSIVALANMNTKAVKPTGPFSDPAGKRIAFRVGTGSIGHFLTSDFDEWAGREKAQLTAEKLRLLYVALTRARDHLVVPLVPPAGKRDGLLAELAKHLPDLDDDTRGQVVGKVLVLDPDVLPEPIDAAVAEAADPTDAEIAAAADELGAWSDDRAASLRAASEGLSVITASSVLPIDRVTPLAATADAGEAAIDLGLAPPVDIGTAVHRVMELITLPAGDDLDAISSAVCAEAGIPGALPEVTELAHRCLQSPTVQRALHSDRYEREVPFGAVLEDGTHLVGRMDLVFREGDELTIVDFKTDLVTTAEEADDATVKHSGQASAYASATTVATALQVRGVVFVYARLGVDRCVSPPTMFVATDPGA